jgi:hypothetical protein
MHKHFIPPPRPFDLHVVPVSLHLNQNVLLNIVFPNNNNPTIKVLCITGDFGRPTLRHTTISSSLIISLGSKYTTSETLNGLEDKFYYGQKMNSYFIIIPWRCISYADVHLSYGIFLQLTFLRK